MLLRPPTWNRHGSPWYRAVAPCGVRRLKLRREAGYMRPSQYTVNVPASSVLSLVNQPPQTQLMMLQRLHLTALGLSSLVALACLGLATYITSSLNEQSASPAASTIFALVTSVISLLVLAPLCVRRLSVFPNIAQTLTFSRTKGRHECDVCASLGHACWFTDRRAVRSLDFLDCCSQLGALQAHAPANGLLSSI
jgi:hypothetical protein